jgi:uncharacterized protein YceK
MASKSALPLLVVAGCLALGCATWKSWSEGCPGVYSGVRFAHERMGEVPIDGKVFFSLDLPLTATLDTLALPATAFTHPKRPVAGFPEGCKWAG